MLLFKEQVTENECRFERTKNYCQETARVNTSFKTSAITNEIHKRHILFGARKDN